VRRTLIAASAAAALLAGTAVAGASDAVVSAGASIPRVEPFTMAAVPCARTSCLDIAWRVRGDIGPALRWDLRVTRPDDTAVYVGSGRSRTGRRVSGRLVPRRPPVCGTYRATLTITDATGLHFSASATTVRRRSCLATSDVRRPAPPA
jgi:hypothetical protein